MKMIVQVMIQTDTDEPETIVEVISLEREDLNEATLGLTLQESKDLLQALQETVVTHQVATHLKQPAACPHCGRSYALKGHNLLVIRTVFGKLTLDSPRLYRCRCQSVGPQSFSPLAALFPERTTPELFYLQTKWAALMSYGLTTTLLSDVLPVDINPSSVHQQMAQAANRLEAELGDEQPGFIEGCPREWSRLPIPDAPLTVGLDGGYVQARDEHQRKAGTFEIIAGKSMSPDAHAKCFALVNGYDVKPRRRLFETLKSQGLQMNQTVIFLSDGGDTVRDLQFYLSPQSEHLLDWFHITMRLTVMQQMVKGLPFPAVLGKFAMDPAHELERIKWFLWHGNVFKALQTIQFLEGDLEALAADDQFPDIAKLLRTLHEFYGYLRTNSNFIPNYGDRYRYGETISTAFVESTVNQVISKRFVKKQQMRWTKRGAHLLLQVRTQVLNGDWRNKVADWYPGMQAEPDIETAAA